MAQQHRTGAVIMAGFERIDFGVLSATLRDMGVDGWLVYDFHGLNPVAARLVGYQGMVTRRVFFWLPAAGRPTAIVHHIDAGGVGTVPGETKYYTTWQELHAALAPLVRGKRVAMEISPENAVPYLDRVPAGLVTLLEGWGVSLVPSDLLVTRFAACWSDTELAQHREAAEALAEIARAAIGDAVVEVGKVTEYDVQRRIVDAIASAGLLIEDSPIVAFGPNAADPHYNPTEREARTLSRDEIVLVDLFAKTPGGSWADQTWMGFSGPQPPPEVTEVWEAVRDARDAAVERLRGAQESGRRVSGGLLDDAARSVLVERGFGSSFTHRTGHSIDGDLHGSGPHLDNFETNDVRELLPGVVFSVEPGVYLKGRFGVRSEINVILGDGGPEVTPRVPQEQLIVAS